MSEFKTESNNKADSKTDNKEVLAVKRIYVKTCTFESAAIDEFTLKNLSPSLDVQFHVNYYPKENNLTEVVVTVIATTKHSDSLVWRVQWQQAGLYHFENFKETDRDFAMHQFCANQLYNYAIVQINNLVQQGGFPSVLFMPIDFGKLYLDRQKEQQKEQLEKQSANLKKEEVLLN